MKRSPILPPKVVEKKHKKSSRTWGFEIKDARQHWIWNESSNKWMKGLMIHTPPDYKLDANYDQWLKANEKHEWRGQLINNRCKIMPQQWGLGLPCIESRYPDGGLSVIYNDEADRKRFLIKERMAPFPEQFKGAGYLYDVLRLDEWVETKDKKFTPATFRYWSPNDRYTWMNYWFRLQHWSSEDASSDGIENVFTCMKEVWSPREISERLAHSQHKKVPLLLAEPEVNVEEYDVSGRAIPKSTFTYTHGLFPHPATTCNKLNQRYEALLASLAHMEETKEFLQGFYWQDGEKVYFQMVVLQETRADLLRLASCLPTANEVKEQQDHRYG